MARPSHLRSRLGRPLRRALFPGSSNYWERRYAEGGNSGSGSYGPVAGFKAQVLNEIVANTNAKSVIEFGCGDGNQLGLAAYPKYIGLDVSPAALRRCILRFASDETKSFFLYGPDSFLNHGALKADLALSLDVILHLVEDEVFDAHMRHLFGASRRNVAIFSSNEEISGTAPHVRYRRFTTWIRDNAPDWRLQRRFENPHKGADSIADLYLFEVT